MNPAWSKPVDFFARHPHYIDHLAPIWLAMDESMRGSFYVPACLEGYAQERGIDTTSLKPPGVNRPLDVAPVGKAPLVTCGYADLQSAVFKSPKRPYIFMQHGVGMTFNHPGYAGGTGAQREVSLFLDPNEHTRKKVAGTWPNKAGFVIGTPKLDQWAGRAFERNEKPVVCISFHWDGSKVAPEAGNAFKHYRDIIPSLAKHGEFTLIGHGHPRVMAELARYYEKLNIEPVWNFDEVMRRADIYINDSSSTLFEFCVTGKPVIVLNAPWFRKSLKGGLRFWDYSDVGVNVNRPEDLPKIIEQVLADDEPIYKMARERAVEDLYPYLGHSAERAVDCITQFSESKGPAVHRIEKVQDQTIGIIYMGFGKKAGEEIRKSMSTLRNVGLDIPVCVVGDTPVRGAQFIEWEGESPFDPTQKRNFQFRAGRVKPKLYQVTPFERTMYIDADTEFIADISTAFELLDTYDIAIANEMLTIGKLYNKNLAGWEINIIERDATIAELGTPDIFFLNSGVMFFRKNPTVARLMDEWSRQWIRWQQWDEQLALMRALNNVPEARLKVLSVDWNHPHRDKAKIIFHNYGRGVCRTNVT